MANGAGVPIERLLAERGWVRALARTLVRNEAGADDLEQQAWVEALENPPAHGRGLRAWFATVLRRRARDAWRTEERRDRRETAAARPEGGRSTADLVAEAEAQRRVVEALLALEEPYREVLLLRFHEDLTPSAIALRQGISRETVKTRLRRALEILRARLGADRKDGSAFLLALAVPDARDLGGILVKTSRSMAVAAALLAAAGVSWWVLAEDRIPPAPVHAAAGPAPESADVTASAKEQERAAAVDRAAAGTAAPAVAKPGVVAPAPGASGVPRDRLPLVGGVEEAPAEADRVDLDVDASGRVTSAGRELGMKAMGALLRERADARRDEKSPKDTLVTAVLRVDRDLPWQGAQWLMQACAESATRIHRISFAAAPDSGGAEGVLAVVLPKDDMVGAVRPDVVEGVDGVKIENAIAPEPAPVPTEIAIRLVTESGATAEAPRDIGPWLARKFPDLRTAAYVGNVDAAKGVATGDVLAVVEALGRAGVTQTVFKGTQVHTGDSLADSLAPLARREGVLRITVNGESISAR